MKGTYSRISFSFAYAVAKFSALPVGASLVSQDPLPVSWVAWGAANWAVPGLISLCCFSSSLKMKSWKSVVGIAAASSVISLACAYLFSEAADVFVSFNDNQKVALRNSALVGTVVTEGLGACLVFAAKALHDYRATTTTAETAKLVAPDF